MADFSASSFTMGMVNFSASSVTMINYDLLQLTMVDYGCFMSYFGRLWLTMVDFS